ncbi:MAG TPA: hypothetical protein VFU36_16225 [Jatrophihabitans sp.]|nr:hypothetical protein [Jatrophihabitans sp.]
MLRTPHARFASLIALLATVLLTAGISPAARATTSPGFDDDGSLFSIYYDCRQGQNPCPGHGTVGDVASPSEDGQSLKIDYQSGNPSYMGIYAYHKWAADHSATRFQINYDFYFPNKAPIQALEFPMNDYINNVRYQWAMQYEIKATGGTWRIWTGTSWQGIGIAQTLNAGTWYTLTIDGDLVSNQVHYMDFIVNGTSHSLTGYSFNPTSGAGDFLVAAMQLDGDSNADPFQVYYDNCHFYWA